LTVAHRVQPDFLLDALPTNESIAFFAFPIGRGAVVSVGTHTSIIVENPYRIQISRCALFLLPGFFLSRSSSFIAYRRALDSVDSVVPLSGRSDKMGPRAIHSASLPGLGGWGYRNNGRETKRERRRAKRDVCIHCPGESESRRPPRVKLVIYGRRRFSIRRLTELQPLATR
jgi:hypothetical protein